MADHNFVLYDTAFFGTTAGVEHVLFQVAEGGDSTHTKERTNSRGAGVLPSTEKFTLRRVEIYPNEALAEVDAVNWHVDGWLSVEVQNQEVFRAPLQLLAGGAQYSGHYTQATAANRVMVSYAGRGFEFDLPVEINGGVPYKIVVRQGVAMSAANQAMVVALHGVLSR